MTWSGMLDNIRAFASMIIESFSSIFQTLATTTIDDMVFNLAGIESPVINIPYIGDLTFLEAMVGIGLPVVLAVSLVKWIIGIIM